MSKLFVYGSLKEGYGLHGAYLQHCRSLGVAYAWGYLFHLGHYPALVLADQGMKVWGEVYEVGEDTLDLLDAVEGHPTHYTRCAVRMVAHGVCQIYLYPLERVGERCTHVIPGGTWLGRNETTQEPYVRYMNMHPEYRPPTKLHMVYDPEIKTFVVNQFHVNKPPGIIGASVIADDFSRVPVVVPSTEDNDNKPILPPVPDEAAEASDGFNLGWA